MILLLMQQMHQCYLFSVENKSFNGKNFFSVMPPSSWASIKHFVDSSFSMYLQISLILIPKHKFSGIPDKLFILTINNLFQIQFCHLLNHLPISRTTISFSYKNAFFLQPRQNTLDSSYRDSSLIMQGLLRNTRILFYRNDYQLLVFCQFSRIGCKFSRISRISCTISRISRSSIFARANSLAINVYNKVYLSVLFFFQHDIFRICKHLIEFAITCCLDFSVIFTTYLRYFTDLTDTCVSFQISI